MTTKQIEKQLTDMEREIATLRQLLLWEKTKTPSQSKQKRLITDSTFGSISPQKGKKMLTHIQAARDTASSQIRQRSRTII
ncbi:MAG: hypothetical protein COV60_00780 [Candidatus Magasanikbacteria bacterium CG11_big_fil_rev_8_21_14_0_20_43_7]|uniref:Uncharacterized protein n=1 Tax=Candidatus Magasanikbacteria bacterium CG11_big_fil_rev_8_21_14_0_20_43_7 TaxID=1974654 RepID=A0A2H0N384_9BACT|nr:MAG: hypothetical protein COV60_00780 [Candidatus Magasanikbacteria bacterium CG11_big_fil_rev_8_21_14_0_20_43_7]